MEKKSRMQELADDLTALRKCLRVVWRKRAIYIKYISISVVLALIVAFSIPKTYSSSVILAPESQSSDMASGLQNVASFAGISMSGFGEDAYSIDLYPSIVSSLDFTLDLGRVKVYSADLGFQTTYAKYLQEHYKQAWWMYPVSWFNSFVSMIVGSDVPVPTEGDSLPSPRFMTKADYAVSNKIQGNVRCAVEQITGVISVTVLDNDPVIAAIVADSVVARLNRFIMDYRTRKARKEYEYAAQLCDSARKSYIEVQNRFVDFASTHNQIYSAAHRAEMDFLENEVALAYQSYSSMVAQMQMAQAKVLESTPVYTIVESAYVPLYADSPKKLLVLIAFVMFACIIATLKVFYGEIFAKR